MERKCKNYLKILMKRGTLTSTKKKYKKDEADNAYNETFLPITSNFYLFLSGTPFRAINSGEFIEDQIYNWSYSDEQNAKANG